MITEELKDRDFEIIGRLMMQERAAEAALLMESVRCTRFEAVI